MSESLSSLTPDQRRVHALPFMGDAPIPAEQDRSVDDDTHDFWIILKLFLRAWPYVRPQMFGRWFVPGKGVEEHIAGGVGGGGYGFGYAPILVTIAAIVGPYIAGLDTESIQFPLNLLYLSIAGMVLSSWPVAFTTGKTQTIAAVALTVTALAANLIATFVIDGFADGIYTAIVTVACLAGWTVHFRAREGRIQYRVRVQAHLVYYYAITFVRNFMELAIGLMLADMLNQSILQADPIMPALASLLGAPEWGKDAAEVLTQAQRHEIKWIYAKAFLINALVLLQIGVVIHYYRVWILQRINQDLRLALLERWHQLSLRYHSDHRVGDSIFRIYQDSAQVTAVIDRLMGVIMACSSYLTCAVLVTLLSPWMGLIVTAVVIPAVLWARWAMPRMRTLSLAARAATSDVISRVQESFGAIRLIKAYGAERRVQDQFEEDSIISFHAGYRVRRLIAFVTIIMFTIASAFLLTGEFLMAYWANRGAETFANELIALVGVSFIIWNLTAFNWTKDQFFGATGAVRSIMRQWLSAQDIAMGLKRVFDILDIEPDIQDDPDAVALGRLKHEIRYDRVAFAYQADRPVLTDVSFTVKPGTVTAIVGPTGSGKSSLMGLLLRLYDPSAGSITIDGQDLKTYRVESLRKNIAVALQENVLFALSVRDNIRYVAPTADDKQVREAIRIACMDDYVDGLPDGIDTVLGDRGGKLSTGQRQRLSIARAVVRDTSVLILDEPTAALDAATEHRVMDNLAQWGRDRAIFLITHRISTIRRADNILYLDDGRIIESGDHETLMKREGGRYRSFVEAESNLYSSKGDQP